MSTKNTNSLCKDQGIAGPLVIPSNPSSFGSWQTDHGFLLIVDNEVEEGSEAVPTDKDLLSNLPVDSFGLEWAQRRLQAHYVDLAARGYPSLDYDGNAISLPRAEENNTGTQVEQIGTETDVEMEESSESYPPSDIIDPQESYTMQGNSKAVQMMQASDGSDSPLSDPPSDIMDPQEHDSDVEKNGNEDNQFDGEDDQAQEVGCDRGFSDAVSTIPVPWGPTVRKVTDAQRQRYVHNLKKTWHKKTEGEDPRREIDIPSGYSYVRIARTNKKTKDEDLYLYGHPSHHTFRSVNEFYPHLEYLIRKWKGNNVDPCPCKGCLALKKRK